MKLVIISNAPLIKKGDSWFAYSPYVKEIEIWSRYADEVVFCCPIWKNEDKLLVNEVSFKISRIFLLSDFNVKTLKNVFISFFQIFFNFFIIARAMSYADHIHLRCPGNVGLLSVIIQIAFPNKNKTAKYAGNWDPNAKSPLSYRIQKYILSNTFLTRNMKVLVYGEWENQTSNIKSFFTATYSETEKKPIDIKKLVETVKIIFVGTLSLGKNPLYAIKLIQKLITRDVKVELSIYGEGKLRSELESYIDTNCLKEYVFLKGNQNSEVIKEAYQESHFVLLPSKSEGWPKAVAEGMFWGCIPISTAVSCVPYMLDFGKRGFILEIDLEKDSEKLSHLIKNQVMYEEMVQIGIKWSRKFTLDTFEEEIKLLLQS